MSGSRGTRKEDSVGESAYDIPFYALSQVMRCKTVACIWVPWIEAHGLYYSRVGNTLWVTCSYDDPSHIKVDYIAPMMQLTGN